MTLFFVIYATMSWAMSQLSHVTVGLETTVLEFIMLGRIPATDLYLQFETLVALFVALMFAATLRVLFYNPYPTD